MLEASGKCVSQPGESKPGQPSAALKAYFNGFSLLLAPKMWWNKGLTSRFLMVGTCGLAFDGRRRVLISRDACKDLKTSTLRLLEFFAQVRTKAKNSWGAQVILENGLGASAL